MGELSRKITVLERIVCGVTRYEDTGEDGGEDACHCMDADEEEGDVRD